MIVSYTIWNRINETRNSAINTSVLIVNKSNARSEERSLVNLKGIKGRAERGVEN